MTAIPAGELIDGVAAFLRDEVGASGDARLAFQARVAANALAIAGRELALGDAANRAAVGRLEALLDMTGERDQLERALCAQIAAGRIADATPGLLAHLWAATLDALAIDQPTYAGYLRALADRDDPDSTV